MRVSTSLALLLLLLSVSLRADVINSKPPVGFKAKLSVSMDGTLCGRLDVVSSRSIIELDAVGFQSLEVEGLERADWVYDGAKLRVNSRGRDFLVVYRVKPQKGLHIHERAIWTAFHTWHWLPCFVDPSERVTLEMEVEGPPGWESLTTGDIRGRGPGIASKLPHPSYVLGFALLRSPSFHERVTSNRVYRFFGAGSSAAHLANRTVAAAERFDQSFAHGPNEYVTVFVPGNTMQELAGMAFLPEKYVRTVVEEPREDWLIVHEYAHQAFGNLITCRTWGDFWLNEGLVVWWVAEDKLLRGDWWGYERERALRTKRVARHLESSLEKKIYRPGVSVEKSGGGLVYSGGALVVAEIANHIGTDKFISNLRNLLQQSQARGRSVDTETWLGLHLSEAKLDAIRQRLGDAELLLKNESGWFMEPGAQSS